MSRCSVTECFYMLHVLLECQHCSPKLTYHWQAPSARDVVAKPPVLNPQPIYNTPAGVRFLSWPAWLLFLHKYGCSAWLSNVICIVSS